MNQLTNKRILLGITGSIAAYKSAELCREFKKSGAEVRVVMTEAAKDFITPLTLQALSGNPVRSELLDPVAEAGMSHIELARWADRIVIAPASANFIADLAAGRAHDLLTTLCLATQSNIMLAPAMNQAMWQNAAEQRNVSNLKSLGIQFIGPSEGSQACGDTGPGRMSEPKEIVELVATSFRSSLLDGLHVVITAGPTQEPIDPVRFLSNRSSGKMGFALAKAAIEANAKVTLIAGPTSLVSPDRVKCVDIITAEDMLQAVKTLLPSIDIFIGAAAVADYRPKVTMQQKMKKTQESMLLELIKNPDIISHVAAATPKPFTVGFAAETENVINYAKQKLQEKNLDVIIANDVSDSSIGFNSDDNAVTIIWRNGQQAFPVSSKQQLARKIIHFIGQHYQIGLSHGNYST